MIRGDLARTLGDAERGERRAAIRQLLRHPLTTALRHPDAFADVVRHRAWLRRWFADHTGWVLSVDPAAGFARLHKVPPRRDATRPARLPGKPPFDRRRYTLLCLILAALEDAAAQTTLALLAEAVGELSADDPRIDAFDPDRIAERRAFVDAVRWLIEAGALGVRDGDTGHYTRSREANALYDVDDRLLRQLVSAPVPPAIAQTPQRMLHEHYPDTDEGARLRARHGVLRRLLDDPVVYYDDLDPHAYEWLDHSRGFVYRMLERQVGLAVERRREGLAAIDPEGRLTDTAFPAGDGTVKHAALLLAEQLARRRSGHPLTVADVERTAADLIADYGERCGWSRQYLENGGHVALAADALALLEQFGLARIDDGGVRARPAIARFAPRSPEHADRRIS